MPLVRSQTARPSFESQSFAKVRDAEMTRQSLKNSSCGVYVGKPRPQPVELSDGALRDSETGKQAMQRCRSQMLLTLASLVSYVLNCHVTPAKRRTWKPLSKIHNFGSSGEAISQSL